MILIIQSLTTSFHLLLNLRFQVPSILLEAAELLDQTAQAQAVDVLTVFRQSHLAHKGSAFMVEGNGDHRLAEKQREENIVKASRYYEVRCCELRQEVLNRRDGLIDNSSVVVRH